MVTEQDNCPAIEIELEKGFLFLNLCGLNTKGLLSHSSFDLCEKSKFFVTNLRAAKKTIKSAT